MMLQLLQVLLDQLQTSFFFYVSFNPPYILYILVITLFLSILLHFGQEYREYRDQHRKPTRYIKNQQN